MRPQMGVSVRSPRCVNPAMIRLDANATIMATTEDLLDMEGGDQMGALAHSARCVRMAAFRWDANTTTTTRR